MSGERTTSKPAVLGMDYQPDFPILNSKPAARVPWGWAAQYEKGMVANHYQSMKRLAERQGLCWQEMYYAMKNERWPLGKPIDAALAQREVEASVQKWRDSFVSGTRHSDV